MTKFAVLFLVVMPVLFHAAYAQRNDFSTIDFRKADSIAKLYEGHRIDNIPVLAGKLTTPLMTDVEKFRAIYTWVCTNIENDIDLYYENKQKRDMVTDAEELRAWNKKFTPRVFEKLMREKKTVCTGYAYLVRELALQAGLNCVSINGYGRTAQSNIGGRGIANHSWNAVQLNNTWYVCDATWSSGSIDVVNQTFIQQYDDAYFLADPELFIRSHYPLDSTWTLLTHKPSLNDFLNGPLVYRGAFQQHLTSFYPDVFSVFCKKDDTITFRFGRSDQREIKKAQIQVERGALSTRWVMLLQEDGLYVLNHTFRKKGIFTVHILLDSVMVVTYTVKVE